MISVQSLSDSLIPNVYVKNLALNSKYQSKAKVNNSKNAGYYDPDNPYPNKTIGFSAKAMANLTMSMKFVKNKKTKSHLMQLLNKELSEYIQVFVHQITDRNSYEKMLAGMNPGVLAKDHGDEGFITTKVYNLKDIISAQDAVAEEIGSYRGFSEQTLDNGIIINETIIETDFNFDDDVAFLAYIIVPAIQHEDIPEIMLGKVSADIIILNKTFQNEGLIFTIAQFAAGSDVKSLLKFGKPGEVWAGCVHQYEGNFMVGPKHTPDKIHPKLNYQIVPISKFVDNRIGDKIERNIINVTKTFEKLNSSTTRYKNSGHNLLDFENYKKESFISDIILAQDEELNVNGFFSVDKYSLIKKNCAFPFLFDNIEQAFAPAQAAIETNKLLNSTKRVKLSVYENELLLGTYASEENFFNISTTTAAATNIKNAKNQFLLLEESWIKTLKPQLGIKHFSFKRGNGDITTHKYKVDIEYTDPTIDFVSSIIQSLIPAQEELNILLKRLQIMKPNASGAWEPGFDTITKRINDTARNNLLEEQPIKIIKEGNSAGTIVSINEFINNPKSFIYFYVRDHGDTTGGVSYNYDYFKHYIKNLSNINTATIDSLLILVKFLATMRSQLEASLSSFGAKKSKSDASPTANLYTASKEQGNVNSAREKRIIKASQENKISIVDHGYDFTGFIKKGPDFQPGRNNNAFLQINAPNYKSACERMLLDLTYAKNNPSHLANILNDTITPKGLGSQKISTSAYTYLNMPNKADWLNSCILLPNTVINIKSPKVKIESIFTSILKFNNSLYENTSGSPLKTAVRKNLDTILANKFGTNLPLVPTFGEQSTAGTGADLSSEENDAGSGNASNPAPPPPVSVGTSGTGTSPFSFPAIANIPVINWKEQKNNNFLLASLLSKLLISRKYSLVPPMSKANFLPYSVSGGVSNILSSLQAFGAAHNTESNMVRIPLQVLALSPAGAATGGMFFDYKGDNAVYMNKNVINPLLLCYYWFKHQNIAKVEFLEGFEETSETAFVKNKIDPYSTPASVQIKKRNVKKPIWKPMNPVDLNALGPQEKMLCRITRYEYPYYIDKDLVKALNLPLINNYFTLRGGS